MKLPKAAGLVFNAPSRLPEELLDDPPGYSWFDMLDDDLEFIEPSPRDRRRLESLESSCNFLADALVTLVDTCAWSPSEIFLFGYGQGGTVALDLLLRPPSQALRCLGGVVGISTEVLPERIISVEAEVAVPGRRQTITSIEDSTEAAPAVLLIHGADDNLTSPASAEASAACLRRELGIAVNLRVFPQRGGEMLRGNHAEEMACLMQFLSDHMRGVGRHGSQEAMERLGADEVAMCTEVSNQSEAEVQEKTMIGRPHKTAGLLQGVSADDVGMVGVAQDLVVVDATGTAEDKAPSVEMVTLGELD